MALIKNIVTDYSCPTNGTSDCRAAFLAFKADAQGQDATLTVPAHTYQFYSTGTFADQFLFEGINNLIVSAYGATLTDHGGTGAIFFGCQGPVRQTFVNSARIQSAGAGQSTVTLVTAAEDSRFSIGQWVIVAALDLQGGGYPPNPFYYEFVKISGISSGVISFTTPLKYDGYLSTYPDYGPASYDIGGPATIYGLISTFDCNHDYQGFTFNYSFGSGNTSGNGRTIKFTDVTCTNFGINPSQNETWTGLRVNYAQTPEFDKLVDVATLTDSTFSAILFQSPCPNVLNLSGNNTINTFSGTPKSIVGGGGSITSALNMGPGYGRTDSIALSGTSIASFGVASSNFDTATYMIASGVITLPISSGPILWAVPNSNIVFSGSLSNETQFRILAVEQSDSNTLIRTTLATASWPDLPLQGGTILNLYTQPCPVAQFLNCVGSADAVDLSNIEAYNKPIYSYSKRSYTGNTTLSAYILWGNIVFVKINVTQAYTGIQASLTMQPFTANQVDALSSNRTVRSTWNPVADLKTTGLRTIMAGSVTGTGGIDSIALPGLIWFSGTQQVILNHDVSGEASNLWPIFEIEVLTDQGITLGTRSWRLGGAAI